MAAPPPLILASRSPARQAVLRAAGIDFEVEPAEVDEAAVKAALKAEGAGPDDAARALAELKAIRVSNRWPGALALAGDQILAAGDRWYDKPADLAQAAAQLRALRGTEHVLHTVLAIARDGGVIWRHGERPRLTLRDFSDEFLDRYLALEGPAVLESVGGYRLEGRGSQLFSRIEGDHFAILGLPLMPLLAFLRGHQVVAS